MRRTQGALVAVGHSKSAISDPAKLRPRRAYGRRRGCGIDQSNGEAPMPRSRYGGELFSLQRWEASASYFKPVPSQILARRFVGTMANAMHDHEDLRRGGGRRGNDRRHFAGNHVFREMKDADDLGLLVNHREGEAVRKKLAFAEFAGLHELWRFQILVHGLAPKGVEIDRRDAYLRLRSRLRKMAVAALGLIIAGRERRLRF